MFFQKNVYMVTFMGCFMLSTIWNNFPYFSLLLLVPYTFDKK